MAKKVQFTNRNLVAMVFCSKNCSDLLWKKIILVIEIFLDITRTIFEKEYFFDLLLEVFADLYSLEWLKCKLEQINGM